MRFSSWYPAERIEDEAPEDGGVFQVRAASLRSYPRGKSAMVHYASADDLRGVMRAWAEEQGREGYLYRHTLDLGGRSPDTGLERVLTRFVDRFGDPPRPGPDT